MSEIIDALISEVKQLKADVNYLLRLSTLAQSDWIDYSSLSTIVGWSSTTIKLLYYGTIGKYVFVTFNIQGTSNSTSTSFTLPYAPAGVGIQQVIKIRDNSGTRTTGQIVMGAGSTTALLVPTLVSSADNQWTASGAKEVYGRFWYVRT